MSLSLIIFVPQPPINTGTKVRGKYLIVFLQIISQISKNQLGIRTIRIILIKSNNSLKGCQEVKSLI